MKKLQKTIISENYIKLYIKLYQKTIPSPFESRYVLSSGQSLLICGVRQTHPVPKTRIQVFMYGISEAQTGATPFFPHMLLASWSLRRLTSELITKHLLWWMYSSPTKTSSSLPTFVNNNSQKPAINKDLLVILYS